MNKHSSGIFIKIKLVIAQETMLYYPNYEFQFLMFPDASDKQLGAYAAQLGNNTNVDLHNAEEA